MKLLILITLISSFAHAQHKSRYFYSYAESASTEWEYVMPECKVLSATEFKKLEGGCSKEGAGLRCPTENTVNLKKVAVKNEAAPAGDAKVVAVPKTDADVQKVDDTTKTVKLTYAVFNDMKTCRTTRTKVMTPGGP